MHPDTQSRYVDGEDRYKNWRNEKRALAFNEAINSHAVTVRPYGTNLTEHVDRVMWLFDKHFPLERKDK
jgi:hypothetical protein